MVRLEGEDLAHASERRLRRARLQDRHESLHPGMRVAEVVTAPLAIAGVGARRWARWD